MASDVLSLLVGAADMLPLFAREWADSRIGQYSSCSLPFSTEWRTLQFTSLDVDCHGFCLLTAFAHCEEVGHILRAGEGYILREPEPELYGIAVSGLNDAVQGNARAFLVQISLTLCSARAGNPVP